MCGRYSLICIDDLGIRFRVTNPAFGFRSHFNITPGSTMPVIVQHERVGAVMMQWGLIPHWIHEPKKVHRQINARAETLSEKMSFREILKDKRCIVPASGYFEWKNEGARKIPFYFHLKGSPILAFAGLYDIWRDPSGGMHPAYAIITTGPNDLVEPVHNRMPVILRREEETRWLSGDPLSADEMQEILAPYPSGDMESYPVSLLVNNTAVNDDRVIQPEKGL
jgi:putative SOS response-associated peptidase YedK